MILKYVSPFPALCALLLFLTGCVLTVDKSISDYHNVKNQISLGDSKDKVLSILSPIQPKSAQYTKEMDMYYDDAENLIEIFYARSLRQADGLTTDDEFSPYTFKNGKLIGVGWANLGGAKSQGQTRSSSYQNTTVIVN